jgi:hypothetical protein
MEVTVADLWATGVSPTGHPTQFLREALSKQGVVTSAGLWECEPRSKVTGGRRGHASPTPDDRSGRDVPEPGGRDRADQHRRVEGLLGPHRKVAAARRRC